MIPLLTHTKKVVGVAGIVEIMHGEEDVQRTSQTMHGSRNCCKEKCVWSIEHVNGTFNNEDRQKTYIHIHMGTGTMRKDASINVLSGDLLQRGKGESFSVV